MAYSENPKHITIVRAQTPCYRIKRVVWFDANKGQGNQSANIYVRATNRLHSPAVGIKVVQTWNPGAVDGSASKFLELKTVPQIETDTIYTFAGADFFMSGDGRRVLADDPDHAGPYRIFVSGDDSDIAFGFGLAPNRAHDVYAVEFEWVEREPEPEPEPNPAPLSWKTFLAYFLRKLAAFLTETANELEKSD